MIKRFHQINEAVSDLKSVKFFEEYFHDLLDEFEYTIDLKKINYIKIDEDLDDETNTYYKKLDPHNIHLVSVYSNFAKEGYCPNYHFFIKPKYGRKLILTKSDINEHSKICNIFADCLEGLLHSIEISAVLSTDIEISSHSNPTFTFQIADKYDIPEEELPSVTFEEFYEKIERVLDKLGYLRKFQIVKNEKDNKLELTGNCTSNQFDAVLRRLREILDYNKKAERGRESFEFDMNIIKRKANDCKLELVNPVKVERKLRERND